MRQHVAPHEAEHRMRLVEGLRDGELRAPRGERGGSRATRSAGRNGESHGTVTTNSRVACVEPGVQSGERPREAADRVGHDRMAERRVALRRSGSR